MHHPALAGRPRFDIAEIVRCHRAQLEADQELTLAQRRVLSAIEKCRTSALGGHLDVCRSCGFQEPAYNSCRNRHCPKCQALAQEQWIAARSKRILPVPHFHVVFTLPSELRALARFRPKAVFEALFQAASETLLQLAHSRLAVDLGITMVLHTWTRDLRFHPHVHAIVSAGGLACDGERWIETSKKYLFPVGVMGRLFRGKMLARLRRLHCDGAFDGFDDFRDPEGFDQLIARVASKTSVVYAKRPFRRAKHVLGYLGRYTHRVGISNSRLVDVTADRVVFRTKNGKTVSLTPLEFLRRLVQHVLPPHFVKIRHYGLYASSHVDDNLATARQLLQAGADRPVRPTAPRSDGDWLLALTGRDISRCPLCGSPLVRIPLPRAPPGVNAAAA